MQKTKDIRETVQKRVTSLHDKLSERFGSTHRSLEFHVGDRVWVPHEAIDKLQPLWTGPCEVLRWISNTARYVVSHPSGEQDVYTDRLKLYRMVNAYLCITTGLIGMFPMMTPTR